jgi:hypothetical protein
MTMRNSSTSPIERSRRLERAQQSQVNHNESMSNLAIKEEEVHIFDKYTAAYL